MKMINSFLLLLVCLMVSCAPTPSTQPNAGAGDHIRGDPANAKSVWEASPIADRFTTTLRGSDLSRKQLLECTVNYGNNVYYFNAVNAGFANALSLFLDGHTNLEVSAMAPNVVRRVNNQNVELNDASSYDDYGAAVGYFVTVRDKH